MEDYVYGDEPKPRNNPYTEEDKVVLSKMKKIQKDKCEHHDVITFNFCPREMWGAVPAKPEPPMRRLKFPVENVRFSDTGTAECYTPYECFKLLQQLQRDHMEKENLVDIKYNFMVGADGTIYEGRGWLYDVDRPPQGEHLKGRCIDIAFIGDINDKEQADDVDPFPRLKCERRGYDWIMYGQDKHYIKEGWEGYS